jgi:hypothetical protein
MGHLSGGTSARTLALGFRDIGVTARRPRTQSFRSPDGDRETEAADEHWTRRQKIGEGVPIERPQERNRCLAKSLAQHATPLDPAEAALSQTSYDGQVLFRLAHNGSDANFRRPPTQADATPLSANGVNIAPLPELVDNFHQMGLRDAEALGDLRDC